MKLSRWQVETLDLETRRVVVREIDAFHSRDAIAKAKALGIDPIFAVRPAGEKVTVLGFVIITAAIALFGLSVLRADFGSLWSGLCAVTATAWGLFRQRNRS
jgi:hypothetical protein